MTPKRNLKKSTRIDEENKKHNYWNFFVNCAWLYRFIWNCIMQNGIWKLNHRKFKILSQQWHWNYTKILRQLIGINFVKSLPVYCIFCARITHWTYFIYNFFVLGILMYFFFLLFYNTFKNSNPEFQKFSVITEIAINRSSQHIFKKTEET